MTLCRWNTGRTDGHSPRLLHNVDHVIILVPATYICGNGHEVLATDPRILRMFPEEEYIPFILFHRSGVMRSFVRTVISLTIQGLSFSNVEHFIQIQRQQKMSSVQLQVMSMLGLHNNQNYSPGDLAMIMETQKPYPSNDMLCKCFLANFAENKCIYFSQMSSLSMSTYISIDHTFKVAANIGYLRADGRWITQYNSLFIVLNNIGQVIAWQFTRTTSIDECEGLLSALKDRCTRLGHPINVVFVDNCCQSRNKLQLIFGEGVCVRLDIVHAAQRITKTISKRHPLCKSIMKDIKLLFRDPSDIGKLRTLPTPDKDILINNVEKFISKWKDASSDGWHIINEKVMKELSSLKVHIQRGCLSGINPSCGTNKNENLHKNINPFFSRCRMGIPLALALLSVLFHEHNLKCDGNVVSILPAKARYQTPQQQTITMPEEFGIVGKENITENDSWIFSSRVVIPTQINCEDMIEIDSLDEVADVCTVDDLMCLLQSSVNLYQMTQNLNSRSNFSPMLNQSIIPFMSSVSCLFDTTSSGDVEDNEKRLATLVHSWGFAMHAIPGDGNCCFSAIASNLLHQCLQLEEKYPALVSKLQLNISSMKDIALQLRLEAVQEWTMNASEYQGYLPSEYSVEIEAAKFIDESYFFGPLANTMIKAVSNALGLPIIVFSSALHYPIVYTTPRVCQVSIPLYVAFNQAGAGHYSALSFRDDEKDNPKVCIPSTTSASSLSRCACGHKDKTSESKRCIPVKTKYTSVVRCSCLAADKSCNSSCLCFNCSNPNGVRPEKHRHSKQTRIRQKHVWQQSHVRSSLYAHNLDEEVTKGPHTQLENLLLSQIVQFLGRWQAEADLSLTSQIYGLCVQLVSKLHLTLPLGTKTDEEIQAMIQNYIKTFAVFKSLCEAHIMLNTK